MQAPFVFGKIATDKDFTDREQESARLVTNFTSGINTVLISPRRWGKSSLVLKASEQARKQEKSLRFCMIDIFNVRSEEEFYRVLSEELIRSVSGRFEEAAAFVKKFLGRLMPKLSYDPGQSNGFSLSLDWKELKKQPDEVLDLAQKLAKEKNVRLVVCIDEFQNIAEFTEPLAFQKKLRSHWQKHRNVSYCLYGSKRHMMMEVFAAPSHPFYKFGDLVFLQKIKENDWQKFIVDRFSQTGKKIGEPEALLIARKVENHPYYVQQLAQQSWLRSKKTCRQEIIEEAYISLMLQMSLLFQTLTEELSTTQINFLQAVINDETRFSAKEVLDKYHLGTSANISRIKEALISREIIDTLEGKVEMLDPLYKGWLKKYYFGAGR